MNIGKELKMKIGVTLKPAIIMRLTLRQSLMIIITLEDYKNSLAKGLKTAEKAEVKRSFRIQKARIERIMKKIENKWTNNFA